MATDHSPIFRVVGLMLFYEAAMLVKDGIGVYRTLDFLLTYPPIGFETNMESLLSWMSAPLTILPFALWVFEMYRSALIGYFVLAGLAFLAGWCGIRGKCLQFVTAFLMTNVAVLFIVLSVTLIAGTPYHSQLGMIGIGLNFSFIVIYLIFSFWVFVEGRPGRRSHPV
jgi:hypothetical protein